MRLSCRYSACMYSCAAAVHRGCSRQACVAWCSACLTLVILPLCRSPVACLCPSASATWPPRGKSPIAPLSSTHCALFWPHCARSWWHLSSPHPREATRKMRCRWGPLTGGCVMCHAHTGTPMGNTSMQACHTGSCVLCSCCSPCPSRNHPQDATVNDLAALYVDAPSLVAGGPPAHLALFRRRLSQDPGMTFVTWAARAEARVAEIRAQQAEVCARPMAGTPRLVHSAHQHDRRSVAPHPGRELTCACYPT